MKINGVDDVNEITLSHKGKNIRFSCMVKPFPYAPRTELREPRRIEIVFDDTEEIFSLMAMLEKFKQESTDRIGLWHHQKSWEE